MNIYCSGPFHELHDYLGFEAHTKFIQLSCGCVFCEHYPLQNKSVKPHRTPPIALIHIFFMQKEMSVVRRKIRFKERHNPEICNRFH